MNDLKADPAERTSILSYHPNIHDEIRRTYIIKGPCQSRTHQFPQTDFSGIPCCFVNTWFNEYLDWLEYNTSRDVAYCLPCYLFKGERIHQGGGNVFSTNIEWDSLKEKVDAFCIKHDIPLPNYDDSYANSGRSQCKVVGYTTLHHYRVDVFYKIIDWQLQELDSRFNEVTSDLLNGVACLNSIDSFSNFDIKRIMRMANLYSGDFNEFKVRALENQLAIYIIDVRDIDKRFSNLSGLGELSRKLVETKKHLTYYLVFLLVKFALLLSVATATVERVFSP